MRHLITLWILAALALTVAGCPDKNNGNPNCPKDAQTALDQTFPDCGDQPFIHGERWIECEQKGREWRVSFWRGSGDCPAGCIHRECVARYLVAADGAVYETDADFKRQARVPCGTVLRIEDVVK